MGLERDRYWNAKCPEPLYSIDTMNATINPLVGSAERRSSFQPHYGNVLGSLANVNNQAEKVDVIMVPRPLSNANEEALSRYEDRDVTVHVRSRRPSAPPAVLFSESKAHAGIIQEIKQKLSNLSNCSYTVSPGPSGDSEIGRKDDYTFVRRSIRRRQLDGGGSFRESRRHVSTIAEESEDSTTREGRMEGMGFEAGNAKLPDPSKKQCTDEMVEVDLHTHND